MLFILLMSPFMAIGAFIMADPIISSIMILVALMMFVIPLSSITNGSAR